MAKETTSAVGTATYSKFISAKDARKMADTTNSLLNRIYKEITELSKEGRTRLCWSVYDYSRVLIDNTVADLSKAGYSVRVDTDDFDTTSLVPVELVIEW